MKGFRKAFTLIELMISISILSLLMMFLYQSYASLNLSNNILKKELTSIISIQKIKEIIYLDYSLAFYKSVTIDNRDKKEDAVFFQSSNSIHKRFNPYITYLVKDKKLYRLESLKEIKEYDLAVDSEFDVDYLGEVKSFRVYRSSNKVNEIHLVHVDYTSSDDILLKIKVLNEY